MRNRLGSGVLVAFFALLSVLMIYYFVLAVTGTTVEQWETSNGTFKIRVFRRPEVFKLLPRYFYYFQCQPSGANKWSEITTLRFDDPLPIPREQIRFVNRETAYFFMISTYAVTTDAGKHWFVFNVRTDPPLGKEDSYITIRDVRLDADGKGTMTVYSKASENDVELRTVDYGKHWKM